MSSSSAVTVIPKRFCGLRVLLVEPDKCSLQHHAHMLLQNSYRVTTATEASNGLSMMMNGHTYDCVLIDADMFEMDMEAFLHQVLKHQPLISIILMAASDDIHLRIPKEFLKSGEVSCLLKPCNPRDICDIWKHICRNRIPSEENVPKEKLNKKDNIRKNVHRKDLAVKDATTINNDIPLGNFTDHQAIDIFAHENDAMFKQVSYQDLFSDDDKNDEDVDEITIKEDKGKKPFIPKNDKYPKNKKEKKTRVTWKGELDAKFKVALKELGEQASSTAILKHMNVPGLTRFHVASHLQKYHQKQKNLEACIAALARVQSFANITQSNNDASIIQPKHNMAGICYMDIDNIRAILQEAPSLSPVPQLTTTPVNNYGDDQAADPSFGVVKNSNFSGQGIENQLIGHDPGNAMAPLGFGETVASDYNQDIDIDRLLSGSENGNFGDASGSGLGEVPEQLACLGPPIEPWDVADCGGIGALLNDNQEVLAMPDFLSCDSGSLCPPQDFFPPQDFQLNSESLCPVLPHSTTLFDAENCINQGPDFGSASFRPGSSADFPVPEFPTEENASLEQIVQQQLPVNSSVPLDDSEDRFIENVLSQFDLENALGLLNDDIGDGNLVDGQSYFQSSWT